MSGFNEFLDKTAVTQAVSDAFDIGDSFTQKEETDVASPTESSLLMQAPPALFMRWTLDYSLKRLSSLYSPEAIRFNEVLKQRFREHPELKGVDDGVIFVVLWARSHPTWRLFKLSATRDQFLEFYLGNMVVEPFKIERSYILNTLSQNAGISPDSVNDFLNKTQMRFSRFPILGQLQFNMLTIEDVEFKMIFYVAISDDDALQTIKSAILNKYKVGGNEVRVYVKKRFLPDSAKVDPSRAMDSEMVNPMDILGVEKEVFFIRTKWTSPQIMLFTQHMNNVGQTPEEYFKNIRNYIRSTFPK